MLTSWKEIAQYLGKGVRTVQRWEEIYGLPVRRLSAKGRHAVLAIPEELDSWVLARSKGRPSELESLRRENALLRAENAILRVQRGRWETAPVKGDFELDYGLLHRSYQQIFATTQLREQTAQLHTALRTSRTLRSKAAALSASVTQ